MSEKTFRKLREDKINFAYDFEKNEHRAAHRHHSFQLLYASSGVMLVNIDGRFLYLPPFRALWIPAGMEHSITFISDTKMRTLYFSREEVKAREKDVVRQKILIVTPLIRELFSEIFKRKEDCRLKTLMRETLLELVVSSPRMLGGLYLPASSRLQEICRMITANRDWDISLEDAARAANLSPKTFSRHFTKEAHLTFRDWKVRMRLSLALEAMSSGSTIKAACFSAGYSKEAVFSSAFRKEFGLSPSEFRKLNVSGVGS